MTNFVIIVTKQGHYAKKYFFFIEGEVRLRHSVRVHEWLVTKAKPNLPEVWGIFMCHILFLIFFLNIQNI